MLGSIDGCLLVKLPALVLAFIQNSLPLLADIPAGLLYWPVYGECFCLTIVATYCNSTRAREWQGRESIANNDERLTQKQRIRGGDWTNGVRELAYERENYNCEQLDDVAQMIFANAICESQIFEWFNKSSAAFKTFWNQKNWNRKPHIYSPTNNCQVCSRQKPSNPIVFEAGIFTCMLTLNILSSESVVSRWTPAYLVVGGISVQHRIPVVDFIGILVGFPGFVIKGDGSIEIGWARENLRCRSREQHDSVSINIISSSCNCRSDCKEPGVKSQFE